MSKLFTGFILIVFFIFLTESRAQQVPNGFNYQTIVRDAIGLPIVNSPVRLRINIIAGSITGAVIYQEEHTQNTNQFGLVNLIIGNGTQTAGAGTFSQIDWSSTPMFIRLEVDNNGTYSNLGTTQFQSVPYAMAADNALKIQNQRVSPLAPADQQFLKFNSTTGAWEPSFLVGANGGTVTTVTGLGPISVLGNGGLDPVISILPADAIQDGYLRATDFQIFSNKLDATSVAGGDLTGPYNNLTVNSIGGIGVSTSGATIGQALIFDGTIFRTQNLPSTTPTTLTGINGVTITGSGFDYTIDGQNLTAGSGIQILNGQIINASPNVPLTLTGLNNVTVSGSDNNFTISGASALWQAGINGVAYYNQGSIGIGTSSPLNLLHVASSTAGVAGFITASNADNSNFINIYSGRSGANFATVAYRNTSDLTFGTLSTPNNEGSYVENMRLTSGGNLGIGEVNPLEKLVVAGNISISGTTYASNMRLSALSNGIISVDGLGNLTTTSLNAINPWGNSSAGTITGITFTGGNVAIGTSLTGARLKVGGDISAKGLVVASQTLLPTGTSATAYSRLYKQRIYIPAGTRTLSGQINMYKYAAAGNAFIQIRIGGTAYTAITASSNNIDQFEILGPIDVSAFAGTYQMLEIWGQSDALAAGVILQGYSFAIND